MVREEGGHEPPSSFHAPEGQVASRTPSSSERRALLTRPHLKPKRLIRRGRPDARRDRSPSDLALGNAQECR
jgi:hypothetical protein